MPSAGCVPSSHELRSEEEPVHKSPKVLIAGGGIGGAATAVALLRRGIEVQLFEQAPALQEVGAGVQISPNGSRALDSLGVFDELQKLSCKPDRKEFRLWNTGAAWPMFDLGPAAVRTYGYPYLTVYRPDLLDALVAGIESLDRTAINLDSKVVSFSQDKDGVALRLEDGRTVEGDILIGADGVRSVIRQAMWNDGAPAYSGLVAWRSVIPMETLPAHMRQMVGSTWIGPRGHVVNYPLHGGALMNFVGTIERPDWNVSTWRTQGTAKECADDFRGWHEDVYALIAAAPALSIWALMVREPMRQWTQGRVTLLGDACHPTLPFLAQGAVMAIEDGVVLGRSFELASRPQDALLRYEAARIDRTARMVRGARDNTERFHNPLLATEDGARAYLQSEWGREPIADRYDWLYSYDAAATTL